MHTDADKTLIGSSGRVVFSGVIMVPDNACTVRPSLEEKSSALGHRTHNDSKNMCTRNRRHLRTQRLHSAGIQYERQRRIDEERSLACGSWCALYGFGANLDHRPIKFAQPIPRSWLCSVCEKLPACQKKLPCGHIVCVRCIVMATMSFRRLSGSYPEDVYRCPKDGVLSHRSCIHAAKRVGLELVLKMRAHCFSVDYGCPYQDKLENVLKHFEMHCSYRPVSTPREDIPAMGAFSDRYIGRPDKSGAECHYGSQERSVGGAVGCVQQNAAGRPAAAGSPSRPASYYVEELVQQLAALNPLLSEEGKSYRERPHVDYCFATCNAKPSTVTVSTQTSGTDDGASA
ncbi:hypothetical protein V5799_029326 [Amblyomma americanum]|uniref:RING-type domain-containing protein n=1 Tax=Amblyomma americanum TaxID=6943 RepID=A0AAQ4ERJ5_AMBAM